jgi:hypothetical protein
MWDIFGEMASFVRPKPPSGSGSEKQSPPNGDSEETQEATITPYTSSELVHDLDLNHRLRELITSSPEAYVSADEIGGTLIAQAFELAESAIAGKLDYNSATLFMDELRAFDGTRHQTLQKARALYEPIMQIVNAKCNQLVFPSFDTYASQPTEKKLQHIESNIRDHLKKQKNIDTHVLESVFGRVSVVDNILLSFAELDAKVDLIRFEMNRINSAQVEIAA